MPNQYNLNFNYINQRALPHIVNLITQWLPNGDFCNTDYCPLNPTRNDKHKGSFHINTQTAQWCDFATNDKGSGLISLYAYIKGISHLESAKFLKTTLNLKDKEKMNIIKFNENTTYDTLTLAPDFNFNCNNNAVTSWAFRNLKGEILIVTDRFDYADGSKKILPRCYVLDKNNNTKGWLQKKLLDYNPLYNLENFQQQQNLPVLFVEGEKSCEAAKRIYGKDFWCTTWLGGSNGTSKVNTSIIKGRIVYLLPDNDEAGRKAMQNLSYKLQNDNTVYIVNYPQNEFQEAWDVADAFPSGWDKDRLIKNIVEFKQHPNLQNEIKNTNTVYPKETSKGMTQDTIPFNGKVNGKELIDNLTSIICRHVIISPNEALAIAYWILQTYNINVFTYAPRLLIISPEKRCGKSTLLQLLEMLSYRSWPVGNCTPSVLYKIISQEQPTILIDEADSFFNGNNDIRNIINSGFQKKFGVARSCGKNFEEIKNYNVFSMMAIAAINNLPDTIMDRGIKINMRRKLQTETVQPLRERIVHAEFELIKSKCKRLMLDIGQQAGNNIITHINGLNDRACDVWEGMLSIASILGDNDRLTKAAITISAANMDDSDSLKNVLLKHILKIFFDNDFQDISSSELIYKLIDIEDAPWGEINKGKPLTPHKLSYYLKEYKISTFQKWSNGHNTNHYSYSAFENVFIRYIPEELNKIRLLKEKSNGTLIKLTQATGDNNINDTDGFTPLPANFNNYQ